MLANLFDNFRDRRILLTGHTGFKGSWLALWLKSLGADVLGFALEPPTSPSHFVVANIQDLLVDSVIDDLRDYDRFSRTFADFEPDLVMHLAAQSVVRTGYLEPLDTFATNVMGTVHVLEAVRRAKRGCAVLLVTSDKCYENIEQTWGYRECDPMGDHDPYGGSKGAAELAVRAYQHSFFPVDRLAEHDVWLATARAGNVIGGGDWTADALIVDTVAALVADQPVSIRSPHAVRPWQHVLQCLSGYLTIAARLLARQEPRVCGNWNIGPYPGGELTVREIVEYFIACWGSGRWVDASPQRVDREAEILRLSIDKALTHLGWCPTWDVRTTLEMTAEWFQAFQTDPKHMQRVSNAQIEKFQADFFVRTPSLTPTAGRCP